jgi:RNA polymerase-binding transcription factor DksA
MDVPTQTHLTTLRALLKYRQHDLLGDAPESDDVDELADVEAALERPDNGTYGDCVDCGEPITLQRLLVQPAARRCAACAAEDRVRRRPRLHS